MVKKASKNADFLSSVILANLHSNNSLCTRLTWVMNESCRFNNKRLMLELRICIYVVWNVFNVKQRGLVLILLYLNKLKVITTTTSLFTEIIKVIYSGNWLFSQVTRHFSMGVHDLWRERHQLHSIWEFFLSYQ